jgi:hypothetical protein
MEQLMYKKIILFGDKNVRRFLQCVYQRPMHVQFAQQSVTSLFLVGSLQKSTLMEIISLCNRVTRLVIVSSTDEFKHDGSSLWHALEALPLQSLVIAVDIEFKSSISTSHMFKNLTHLDINDHRLLTKPHPEVVSLPALTHFCAVLRLFTTDPIALVSLIANARLRVVAFRVEGDHFQVEGFLARNEIQDRRIVLLPINLSSWGELGQGDMLTWELAEERVNLPISKGSG